jgi:hypothetical protein
MRIGTWNLEGRWTARHRDLLAQLNVDVWLLSEVREDVSLDGYHWHATQSLMAPHRHWSAILARERLEVRPDPHPASAAALVKGTLYVSSVLPWRTAGATDVWDGPNQAAKMSATLAPLERVLAGVDAVWGGDWNQSLCGREYAGSLEGRRHLIGSLDRLGMEVPTRTLRHRCAGVSSIDHVAVSQRRCVESVAWVDARGLSDHDAYVVELSRAETLDPITA